MWADNETTEDLLGFKIHADLIIDVLKDDSMLPVTIGVFGDWGGGKSSILRMVEKELKGKKGELKEDTLVLYFNGWVFEGYDDAKAALLESIIKEFDKHKTVIGNIEESTKKLFKSVKWMRVAGLGFKHIVLPGAAAYLTGGLSLLPLAAGLSALSPEQFSEKIKDGDPVEFLQSLTKEKPEEDVSLLVREFREDFEEMINKSKIKKLVVIVDDLDRCTSERLIENLEAIKLFLNVEKTAFIIGADPRIVRHAIERRYHSDKVQVNNDNRIVDDYLEKLIQIPYSLPKLSEPEVETYFSMLMCKKHTGEENFSKVLKAFEVHRAKDRYSAFGLGNFKGLISSTEEEEIKKRMAELPVLIPLIAQGLYGNPRQIKRFLNSYFLRKRLADVASLKDFNDSVLIKLMIIEYTQPLLFKQLFEWQSTQTGKPKQLKELELFYADDKNKEQPEHTKYKDWTAIKSKVWLTVEPQLSEVVLRDYFWLSRDKISSSITGASLIPPIVKAIFKELDNDSLPAKISKQIIRDKVQVMEEYEKDAFLEYAGDALKKNAKNKRYYDIFHFLIDEYILRAGRHYAESLDSVALKDIPVAIGVTLKNDYKNQTDLQAFFSKLEGDNKSAVSKAFNISA